MKELQTVEAASGNWWFQEKITADSNLYIENYNTLFNVLPTRTQAAIELYDLGFNVIPLKHGSKEPIGPWKQLLVSRLPRYVVVDSFVNLNVGVITGRLSKNLFVIDCDNEEVFRKLYDDLNDMDLAKWVVKTPRGGHFWFLSQDGEVGNYKNEYEIWGNNHYVVAPPSIHPSGEVYVWASRQGNLPPLLSAIQIEQLFSGVQVHSKRRNGLPPVAEKVLVFQDKSGYNSWSEAEFAAANSLYHSGYDRTSIRSLFRQYNPPHYASKRDQADEWLIENMLLKIETTPARNGNRKSTIIDQALEGADEILKGCRTCSTDRRVFKACCDRAKLEKADDFRATVREIAEIASVTRKTAGKALRRLCTMGFLWEVTTSNKGNRYALRPDQIHDQQIQQNI